MAQIDEALKEINKNLEKAIKQSREGAFVGLEEVGAFVQGESEEIAPHRKGVMVGGAFHDTDRETLTARIGYTAKYAPWVHEMPESNNFTKPGTGPKFLEKPVMNNVAFIVNLLFRNMRF